MLNGTSFQCIDIYSIYGQDWVSEPLWFYTCIYYSAGLVCIFPRQTASHNIDNLRLLYLCLIWKQINQSLVLKRLVVRIMFMQTTENRSHEEPFISTRCTWTTGGLYLVVVLINIVDYIVPKYVIYDFIWLSVWAYQMKVMRTRYVRFH